MLIDVSISLLSLPVFLFISKKQGIELGKIKYLVAVYALLTLSIIFVLIGLVGPFGGFDFYRFSRFLVPWSVLALALLPLIGNLLSRGVKLVFKYSAAFLLILAAVGGLLAINPSAYIFQPNSQVTSQEVSCMRWVFEHGKSKPVRGIWSLDNLANISLDPKQSSNLQETRDPVPDHFGYDQSFSLAEHITTPTYLLVTESDRETVLELWASAKKYEIDDFIHLMTDPAANLLFDNAGCTIWLANPLMERPE